MKEWSLLIFTILVQLGVGAFIFTGAFYFYQTPLAGIEKIQRISFSILSGILLLATLISFFHLGNPLKAFNAMNNIGTSWLSREILLNSLFLGLVILITAAFFGRLIPIIILKWAYPVASISGLVLIFAMAKLYMLPVVPVWNNFTTPIFFYLTSIVLGSTFCLLVISLFSKNFSKWITHLLIILILGLILEMVTFGTLSNILSNNSEISTQSLGILVKDYLPLIVIRILSAVIPLFLFLLALFNPTFRIVLFNKSLYLYLVAGSILLSEVLGRFLFFISFVKTGI